MQCSWSTLLIHYWHVHCVWNSRDWRPKHFSGPSYSRVSRVYNVFYPSYWNIGPTAWNIDHFEVQCKITWITNLVCVLECNAAFTPESQVQVVSTCILYQRQNCRHSDMYPLVSASRTLLRTWLHVSVGYKLLFRDTCIRLHVPV